MDTINWTDVGIEWKDETVSRKNGNTKVGIRGVAQVPHLVDIDKFVAKFGAEPITGGVNGTSWRVAAQDVNRRMLPNNPTVEGLRAAIINRIRSIRNSPVGGPRPKIYVLPNGQQYVGNDLTAYRQVFVAALSSLGVPNEVAIKQSQALTL